MNDFHRQYLSEWKMLVQQVRAIVWQWSASAPEKAPSVNYCNMQTIKGLIVLKHSEENIGLCSDHKTLAAPI